MSNAALIAFWVAVAVLWGVDGRRIPLVFIGLWVATDIGWTHFSGDEVVMRWIEGGLALALLAIALATWLRRRRRPEAGSGEDS